MEDTISDLRADIRDFRGEVNDKLADLDERMRPVEQVTHVLRFLGAACLVIGPVALTVAFR